METGIYTACFALMSWATKRLYPWYRGVFKDVEKLEEEAHAAGRSLGYEAGAKMAPLVHSLIVAPASIYALLTEASLHASTVATLGLDGKQVAALAREQIYSASPIAMSVVPVTMAFFLYDLSCYSAWSGDSGTPYYNEMMLLHHVLSLILFPASLARVTGHWFLLVFLSYELSSPFIYFRWFSQRILGKGTVWTVSSALFLATFLMQRVCTIPALTVSVLETFNYPEDSVLQVLAYSSFVPMALNLTWAVFIVKAAVQEIGAKLKEKKE